MVSQIGFRYMTDLTNERGIDMATISNGSVYEYIESMYDELEKFDGGYYPSKHDKQVFELAAKKFDIEADKAESIYQGYQEIVGQKLVSRLNRLPMKQRVKKHNEMLSNIVKNNRDLPFAEIEGPATEGVISGVNIIYEEYSDIATKIGENGWTIPMSMGLSRLDMLKSRDINNEALDDFFLEYYTPKLFKLLIKHVNNSDINDTLKGLFNDCISVYKEGKYLMCSTSLLTIIEGTLCEFGDDKTDIRMMRICRFNMDKTKSDKKIINHLVWISFFSFVSSLYKKSNFNKVEPIKINRHWILHGRTQNSLIKADCLRLFNFIYALITMKKYDDR